MASEKYKKAARESYGFVLIVGGILVLLNVLGMYAFGRIDLTRNKLFSLSSGSEKLASSLKDRMEVVAYFTQNLPPPFNATERYVRDLLAEYAAASNGKIRVRHVNPDTEEKMQDAEKDGIRKVSHQMIENDGVNVKEGFRGVVFKYLGDSRAVPVIEDTAGLEYQFTQLIKEMTGEKVKIGVVTGKGGPTFEKGLAGLKQSMPTYTIQDVNLASGVPADLKALLVISPDNPLTDPELKSLDDYVSQGGSLGIFGGRTKLALEGYDPQANMVDTGLNKLLKGWGLRMDPGLVADARCGRAPMQTNFGLQVLVPYPLVPIVTFEDKQAEHPTLFKLNQLGAPFVTPILTVGSKPTGFKRTLLAKSSKDSWLIEGENISIKPKQPREWSQSGKSGPFGLAYALEGKLPSGLQGTGAAKKPTRVLVVGTANFMRDEFLPQAGPQGGGQRELGAALAFALNAVDWLAQDSDLIAIRAKNIEDPPLEVPMRVVEAEQQVQVAAQERDKKKVEAALEKRKAEVAKWDGRKSLYRWSNTLFLPILFAFFGLMRWRNRKAIRQSQQGTDSALVTAGGQV